ncbi:MAG TPA: hypothetical protein VLG39_06410, partial [Nitrospirota bacterium]|nr:hypothetical protein [Nitrospirota bacterium]
SPRDGIQVNRGNGVDGVKKKEQNSDEPHSIQSHSPHANTVSISAQEFIRPLFADVRKKIHTVQVMASPASSAHYDPTIIDAFVRSRKSRPCERSETISKFVSA